MNPGYTVLDQWEKVGNYNTFLTDELRKVTQKLIVYDRQASPDLAGGIGIIPENMAKMAPDNRENVLFKATLFGLPEPGTIFEAAYELLYSGSTASRRSSMLL